MMKLFKVAAVCALFFVISCNNSKYPNELLKIDSLKASIDSSRAHILALDTAELNRRFAKQVQDLNYIQSSLDSISRTNAFIINEYASYKKAYGKWNTKIPIFLKEAELRTNQLNDLEQDINNDLIVADSIASYISNEEDYIMTLQQIVHQMEFGLNSIDSVYKESQLRIDTIIQNIKSDSVR